MLLSNVHWKMETPSQQLTIYWNDSGWASNITDLYFSGPGALPPPPSRAPLPGLEIWESVLLLVESCEDFQLWLFSWLFTGTEWPIMLRATLPVMLVCTELICLCVEWTQVLKHERDRFMHALYLSNNNKVKICCNENQTNVHET